MNGKQNAVIWLGLGLILARLFTTSQWAALWGTVKNGNSNGSAAVKSAPAKSGAVVV